MCLRAAAGVLIVLIGAPVTTLAQPRTYQPDRSDEDWSFLKSAPKTDFWDSLKYIPFGDDWFMTLSGEVRYRPEGFRVRATEGRPSSSDNYLLHRYLFGADVRGPRARVFAEVQSGIINGRLRSPRPTDSNTIDLHQAFFEWRQPIGAGSAFNVKAGRQELAIGSTRLISASPGLNVKRSFDGISLGGRAPSFRYAAAVAQLVGLSTGSFDDKADSGQLFWGAAISRKSPRFERGELGAYYLGVDRDVSLYAQGLGPERRHTVGVKWNAAGARANLNYDGLFQWGEFRDAPIRAWGFATESGYALSLTGWRPRVGVRADSASGDKDAADPRLQSFNPLFPGNSYSGAVGLFGPTNLTDFTPSFTVFPRRTLTVGFEAPSYWRTALADGVYGTDLRLLIPPGVLTSRYLGTNPGVLVVWQATPHWQFQGAITRFLSGSALQNTFVSSGFGFYSASSVYRF